MELCACEWICDCYFTIQQNKMKQKHREQKKNAEKSNRNNKIVAIVEVRRDKSYANMVEMDKPHNVFVSILVCHSFIIVGFLILIFICTDFHIHYIQRDFFILYRCIFCSSYYHLFIWFLFFQKKTVIG